MATNTPTFDFDREDPGADEWTDRINGNFTDIETLLTGGTVNGAQSVDSGATINGTTLADVDTAVDANDYVKLKPGETYTGSTTISIDLSDYPEVLIDARGATISGTGIVCSITGVNDYPNGGRAIILGGDWGSDNSAGSRVFEVTDSENNVIKPHYLRDAEEFIELRNEEHYCEGNVIEFTDCTNDADKAVAFRGADTTGGVAGTNSFKNTELNIQAHVADGGTCVYQSNATLYDSELNISAFIGGNTGKTAWRVDGDMKGTDVKLEVENPGGGANDATGVVEGTENGIGNPPQRTIARFQAINTEWDISSNWVYYKQTVAGGGFDNFVLPINARTGGAASTSLFEVRSSGGIGTVGFSDLQGTTGQFDGAIENHDGSGALPRGAAQWDDTNSQWISLIDGTTFT